MTELSRAECLALLSAHHFGRVAVVIDGAPAIRPVNYVFDPSSQSVVFRTARGSKFHALLHASKASFEIDGIDEHEQTGWSVVIHGATADLSHARDIERFTKLGLRCWAPGSKPHWVHIRASTVTGRRITLPEAPMAGYYLG